VIHDKYRSNQFLAIPLFTIVSTSGASTSIYNLHYHVTINIAGFEVLTPVVITLCSPLKVNCHQTTSVLHPRELLGTYGHTKQQKVRKRLFRLDRNENLQKKRRLLCLPYLSAGAWSNQIRTAEQILISFYTGKFH
jgi:hypothetical protein